MPAIKGELIGALGYHRARGRLRRGLAAHAGVSAVEGGWLINGEKTYITNGVRAHFIVTAAKTTAEGGHHGISFFIVERGQGVSASKLKKLGWAASDTATISFEEAFVPDDALLGGENEGFKLIMANFQWERLAMSLGAVGAMQLAYERTAEYAKQRTAFGRPLSKHQAIRTSSPIWLRSRVHRSASSPTTPAPFSSQGQWSIGGGDDGQAASTQRACFDLMDACLQIHGGLGYMAEHWTERAVRDARLGPIGGGTDEIMREILGRLLGL